MRRQIEQKSQVPYHMPPMNQRIKQGMQLYSMMRYLAAQFIPFFEKDLWRNNAKQTSDMRAYLHEKIKT